MNFKQFKFTAYTEEELSPFYTQVAVFTGRDAPIAPKTTFTKYDLGKQN